MNTSAIMAELLEIGDTLSKGEEADWDVRNKAMARLQELALTAAKHESFIAGLEKIKKHLAAQVPGLLRSPQFLLLISSFYYRRATCVRKLQRRCALPLEC
jgi:hypothetical protein